MKKPAAEFVSAIRLGFASLLAIVPAVVLAAGPDLAGTFWQLVAIQSMDDAQGTTKVAEPSHFTLEFGRDGRAALRLDCNRGTGEYKVAPAGDGSSGSLTFGPVATTRAMCPPPHLDQRVARDLGCVDIHASQMKAAARATKEAKRSASLS